MLIFYQGPSKIDGKPVVAIATAGTTNAKTGSLVQTWVLPADVNPFEAIHTGQDHSVCGDCPLRGIIQERNKGRGCYVLVHQAPLQVWRAWAAGRYTPIAEATPAQRAKLRRSKLRLGSYGDPAAVPMAAWQQLRKLCRPGRNPGYTHQWQTKRFARWKQYLMASTHSLSENEAAQAAGWRTFRTVRNVEELADNEILCPASAEAGYRENCDTCGACNGAKPGDKRQNIAIVAHGAVRKYAVARLAGGLPQ